MSNTATGEVLAYVECTTEQLLSLTELAKRVDRFVGKDPLETYDLPEAFSAILNGGSKEEVEAALSMVDGWQFEPRNGWSQIR